MQPPRTLMSSPAGSSCPNSKKAMDMAAFDRVKSGIDDLDGVLDNIRIGDNVVWRLSNLEEFRYFTEPFVKQAIADKRNLIYVRFAKHPPLVEEQPGVRVIDFNPNVGFEAFTVAVHRLIEREGKDAFYVFDCLSELQVAWSSDLMMGNFFRVTCPYLFELDTVAYFPILRGRHSFAAIEKIQNTTQLFLDVTSGDNLLYIKPIKVWNRESPTMFSAHAFDLETGSVSVINDGVGMSRYYASLDSNSVTNEESNIDAWDRFFFEAKQDYSRGLLKEETCTKMCNMMMTVDPHMRSLVKRYFKPADYFAVRDRMVGTGYVGGKTCGMLVAQRIVESAMPDDLSYFEPHDSFYVGTDVFYTYIVYNGLWDLRVKQSGDGFISAAPELKEGIENGTFPPDIHERFIRILEYFGQCPIIIRSSSFLEDGFGNAFAGKYDSVFRVNTGILDERLKDFEDGVRHVYASALNRSALEYRLQNGLDAYEEQMALLVMRVSGSRLPDGSYMPTAAGVGYSHSAYCWMPDMDPDAGMIRLVMGLGTKAVDRTESDYPRIISLDRPLATTAKTRAEKHKYSQHYANVIDLEKRVFAEKVCTDLEPAMPQSWRRAVFEHDYEAEQNLRERGRRDPVLFASCEGLAGNRDFTSLMSRIMHSLQDAYQNPVDIEFTVNVSDDGYFIVNLLQCRPLQSLKGGKGVEIPDLPNGDKLVHISGEGMGNDRDQKVDVVVMVDPELYYKCEYSRKPGVAVLVGRANEYCWKNGL
ncbi:MAG: PEP/pyruvate-binding domain-containing protein, partial [Coriobacteriales bacterium]